MNDPPVLSAVLLAAGTGSRMQLSSTPRTQARSKLALPLGPSTVVGTSLRALLDAAIFDEIVVVLGHAATVVEAAARAVLHPGEPVAFVVNRRYRVGMSGSIAVGVQALASANGGVAIALADLPLVRPPTIRALARQFHAAGRDAVIRPTYDGQPGHPVLFGPTYRPRLEALDAKPEGARALLRSQCVTTVAENDPGVVFDVDTPESYQMAQAHIAAR